jgi:fibronectin-binding autotransporter adhesin
VTFHSSFSQLQNRVLRGGRLVKFKGATASYAPTLGAVAVFAAIGAPMAQAQGLTWDTTTGDATIVGGSGTWDGAIQSWTSDAGATNEAWTAASAATFGGAAGTVTVSGTQSVGNITFATDGYQVTGGALSYANAGTGIAVATGTATIGSDMTSTTGLTKTGDGALTLSGSNSISGTLDLARGSLTAANAGALAGVSTLVAQSASSAIHLDLGGATLSVGDVILNAPGASTIENGTVSFSTLAQIGYYDTIDVVLAGTGELRKTLPYTATLIAASTHTGVTNVTDGTLVLSGAGALASPTVNISAPGTLRTDGGGLAPGATVTTAGTFTANGDETIAALAQTGGMVDGTGTISTTSYTMSGGELAGTVSSSGAKLLNGGGTISGTLTGAGLTTVQTGTTTLSGTLAGGNVTIAPTGTLALDGGHVSSYLSMSGGTVFASTSSLVDVAFNQTGTNSTLSAAAGQTLRVGTLSPSGFNSVLTIGAAGQTGTVRAEGWSSIISNASFAIDYGTLQIGDASFGANVLSFVAGTSISAGGTLDLGGYDTRVRGLTGTGTVTNNGSAATLTLHDTAGGTTFGGTIQDGAGALGLAIGLGDITLTGANTFSGPTTVTAGTLVLAGDGSNLLDSGLVSVASGAALALDGDETIGRLSGAGAVDVRDDSVLTLGGGADTSFSGALSTSGTAQGRLVKTGTNTQTLTGSVALDTVTVSGGTLALMNGANSIGDINVAGTLHIGATGAAGGAVIHTTGSVIDYANGITNASLIDLNSNTTQVQVLTGSATQSGAIGQTGGARPLEKIGAGSLTLTAANSYTGTTTVTAGELAVTGTGTLASTGITVASGATFSTDGGALGAAPTVNTAGIFEVTAGSETLGALAQTGGTIQGAGTITAASFTQSGGAELVAGATIASAGAQQLQGGTIAGSLTGAGAVTASGANAITGTVTGAASFTTSAGATSVTGSGSIDTSGNAILVSGGSLSQDGHAFADTEVVTVSGGTLTTNGADTIAGLIQSGGTLNGAATLATGTYTMSGGALAGTVSSSGTKQLNGGGTISGTLTGAGLTTVQTGITTLSGTLSGGNTTILSGGTLALDGGDVSAFTLLSGGTLNAVTSSQAGSVATSAGMSSTVSAAAGQTLAIAALSPVGHNAILTIGAVGQTGTVRADGLSAVTNTARVAIDYGTLQIGAALPGQFMLDFTSGTSIAATGTLDIGGFDTSVNALTGSGTVTNSGAAATLMTKGTSAFDGVIQDGAGALALTVTTGTTTLTGTNTYTGATSLTGGDLALTGTGSIASTVVDVAAGRTLSTDGGALSAMAAVTNAGTFALTGDETVGSVEGAGAISLAGGNLTTGGLNSSTGIAGILLGTGGLTKQGSGTLTLSGASTYTGATILTGGRLVVNGALASVVTANSGTILGGSGMIGGAVIRSGATFAPGTSIGTTHVAGDVTFNPGSTYQVEVDPSSGASDLIAAGGRAILNGGTVSHIGFSGSYDPTSSYTIVTAAGGVSGTFSDVVSSFAFLDPQLTYGTNAVVLSLLRNDVAFSSVAGTANQRATATAIEGLTPADTVYASLLPLSAPEARAAYDALSGEVHGTVNGGFVLSGLALADAVQSRATGAGSGGANFVMSSKGTGSGASVPSVWATVLGSGGVALGSANTAKTGTQRVGFLLGSDLYSDGTWTLGAVAGHTEDSLSMPARGSTGNASNNHVGAYMFGQWDALRFASSLTQTWSDVSTRRDVVAGALTNTLTATYGSRITVASAEIGYEVATPMAAFEPFAGLAYVHANTDGFTETGGAGALTRGAETRDTVVSTLGLRASTDFVLGDLPVEAFGSIGWQHAFGDPIGTSTHAFAASAPFTVTGSGMASNAVFFDAGANFEVAPDATLGVSYEGDYSAGAFTHKLGASFNIRF